MALGQGAQRRAGLLDYVGDWLAQRGADAVKLEQDGEAAVRSAWGQAVGAPGLGLGGPPRGLPGLRPRTAAASIQSAGIGRMVPGGAPTRGAPNWLGDAAKRSLGSTTQTVGDGVGLVTGTGKEMRGLLESALFASRLSNPVDLLTSAPGESAIQQLGRGGAHAVSALVDYGKKASSDPGVVLRDAKGILDKWNVEMNPDATPMADTIPAEMARRFNIGRNRGEFAAPAATLAFGGELANAATGFRILSKEESLASSLAQGVGPRQAEYLSQLYKKGMGAHLVPRRSRLPEEILGVQLPDSIAKQPLPKFIMDSPFNVLKPDGITRWQMYKAHHDTDPFFNGGKISARVGGGTWSGKRLGMVKYGPLGRIWFGAPAPLKSGVGGLLAGEGAASNDFWNPDDRPPRSPIGGLLMNPRLEMDGRPRQLQ